MAKENPYKPFYSVLILAFVCSALVAGAAVGLRPLQDANKTLDQKKNILYAANLYQDGVPIDDLFANIEIKVIELRSGEFVSEGQLDPASYNQVKATLTEQYSSALSKDTDVARLGRVEKYSFVYLVRQNNTIDQIILPVRGKGLWSTMYAYVALSSDLNTIRGISFYEHGETPGLGGEIENKPWQKSWQGKQIYDDQQTPVITLIKGKVDPKNTKAPFQIDGLSRATLAANGVSNLMEFWFGDHGFKPFLNTLQKGGLDG